MIAVIVCGFDTYEPRVQLARDYLVKQGYTVILLLSDFKHSDKTVRQFQDSNIYSITTYKYMKNLSFGRLFSHAKFARDAFKVLEKLNPDLVYIVIPPNSLARQVKQYRKHHMKTKIIFDIMDLWPETLPIASLETLPPFFIWRGLRDWNLRFADLILTECDLYREVLKKRLRNLKTATIHLAKNGETLELPSIIQTEKLRLCYLGSINNIIDIPAICELVASIKLLKPVVVHIIGDGETRLQFIAELEKSGAEVIYEGVIYDSDAKHIIFNQCHFGLNIMKESVVIGLTIKSIDYLHAGLPMINSIPADTEEIIRIGQAGFQFHRNDIQTLASALAVLSPEEISILRINARAVYEQHFSIQAYEKAMDSAFAQLV